MVQEDCVASIAANLATKLQFAQKLRNTQCVTTVDNLDMDSYLHETGMIDDLEIHTLVSKRFV